MAGTTHGLGHQESSRDEASRPTELSFMEASLTEGVIEAIDHGLQVLQGDLITRL